MKDDFWSERPSIRRTEVNIRRARQLVCDDRRLTVRMIVNQLNMKKTDFGRLLPKIWSYLMSKGTRCAVPGQEEYHRAGINSLLT